MIQSKHISKESGVAILIFLIQYADLINGVSFGGRQVVKAEDLSDRDTQTGYHKNTRAVKGKKHTKYRDLFRKTGFGANFAVVGIENQKQVHYLMPVRCMEYDVKEYQRQEMEQKKALQKAAEERSEGRFEERLENLRAMMANLKLTAEAAMDILNVPLEERVQYLAKIQ